MDTSTTLTVIGIFIAAVIGVWQIQLARKQIHLSKNQSLGRNNSKLNENEYREKPYPGEIFNVTNQLPLLQRHEARNRYAGIKVKWHGKIQNLYLETPDVVALAIRVDNYDNTSTSVYFKIKISKHPEVKAAQDGDMLWVFGEIKYVDNADIELKNCEIKLD